MIDMHHNEEGTLGCQGSHEFRCDPAWIRNGDTRVNPHNLDMRKRREGLDNFLKPARGKQKRITSGENHLPYGGMRGNPIKSGFLLGVAKQPPVRTYLFAAKAKTAIKRADKKRF